MILDSSRDWVKEMHVDGFRFDLASVFTRNDDGSLKLDDPPICGDIVSDPDLAGPLDRRALGCGGGLSTRPQLSGPSMAAMERPISR